MWRVHGRVYLLSVINCSRVQGSGPVGLSGVMICKLSGASKVINIDGPSDRLAMAKRLGADHTIDMFEQTNRERRREKAVELTDGIGPQDVAGHAEMARALDVPLAVGEEWQTTYQFRELLEAWEADVIMPDISRTSLTQGKRIAATAQAFNVPISPHIGGGAILSIAATVQYSAGIPNFLIREHFAGPKLEMLNELLEEPLVYRDGHLEIPEGPGLGVEVDKNKLEYIL